MAPKGRTRKGREDKKQKLDKNKQKGKKKRGSAQETGPVDRVTNLFGDRSWWREGRRQNLLDYNARMQQAYKALGGSEVLFRALVRDGVLNERQVFKDNMDGVMIWLKNNKKRFGQIRRELSSGSQK